MWWRDPNEVIPKPYGEGWEEMSDLTSHIPANVPPSLDTLPPNLRTPRASGRFSAGILGHPGSFATEEVATYFSNIGQIPPRQNLSAAGNCGPFPIETWGEVFSFLPLSERLRLLLHTHTRAAIKVMFQSDNHFSPLIPEMRKFSRVAQYRFAEAGYSENYLDISLQNERGPLERYQLVLSHCPWGEYGANFKDYVQHHIRMLRQFGSSPF